MRHAIDKMHNRVILAITIFLIQQYCLSSAPCLSIGTCGECIQNPECAWCSSKKKENKCLMLDINTTIECESELITGEKMEYMKVLDDKELSSRDESVQMKPQSISLRVVNNNSYTFKFKFSRAWNPLDLYFLMDNSYTMQPHRKMLSSLGNELKHTIELLTDDFRMGFGTFVEKQVFPFQYHEQKETDCSRGYSYKNYISLTDDAMNFEEMVNNANSSCNVDMIENGLDALAQVLVCEGDNGVGWRHESSRMVVYSTDAEFHVAGDGKLTGYVVPNDGQCHMSGGEYVAEQDMDYPSVSQIGHLMKERNTYVIFAIVCNMTDTTCKTYDELVNNHLSKDLAKFAHLDLNSTTVLTLVNNTYNAILKSVNMTHNFPSEIDVQFRAFCHSERMDSDHCTDIKVGQIVEFEATLHPRYEYEECEEGKQSFWIKPAGIHDYLEIEVDVLCNCDCELNGPQEINAEQCNFHGNTTCGVCQCNEGYSGKDCMCSTNSTDSIYDSECINPKTHRTKSPLCSGSGHCVCGVCKCEHTFYGPYCECQDYNCPKKNGLLCSGLDHGKCFCGQCTCKSGWLGDDCSCAESTELCKPSYNKFVCSHHGNCSCGICECDKPFFGTHCEACEVKDGSSECDECMPFVKCVKDFNNKTVTGADESNIDCTAITNISVTADSLIPANVEWTKCAINIDTFCTITYRFKKRDGRLTMEIGPEKCLYIASIEGLISIIGACIFIAFLSLIAWKVLITIHDKRELATFLEKRKYEKWHNNQSPIYKNPWYTYQNPMYRPKVQSTTNLSTSF